MVDKSCWEVWDVECCIENGRLKDLIKIKRYQDILDCMVYDEPVYMISLE